MEISARVMQEANKNVDMLIWQLLKQLFAATTVTLKKNGNMTTFESVLW